MKNTVPLFFSILILIFQSCDDNESINTPGHDIIPVLEFEEAQYSLPENSNNKVIIVKLDKPAIIDGSVIIGVTTQDQDRFTTIPTISNGKIELSINRGSDKSTFTVIPFNNSLLDADSTAIFKIEAASRGFSIGAIRDSRITITDDERPAQVNFVETHRTISEDSNQEDAILLELTSVSAGIGEIEILVESDDANYGEHFTTSPSSSNGRVSLAVAPGTQRQSIRIIPIDNARIGGNKHVTLSIISTSGAIIKGANVSHSTTIKDDELSGISMSYATSGNGWTYKKYFGFTESGLLSKVYWERYTPGYLGGDYTYHYSGATLDKITELDGTETRFTTLNGRIVKSEKFLDGTLKQYTLYGYDEAGNVGEASVFYRQPDGEMKPGLQFVYLYFSDGNLYKQLTYDSVDSAEPILISTRTYENYLPGENVFPMVEILPNSQTQINLPGTFRIEENGQDVEYNFSYEFDSSGRVRKRTANSSAGNEVTVYNYYGSGEN